MSKQPIKILIVDDNPVNIDILRGFLTEENYQISAVTNGERALIIAAKQNPDLILLDVMMPGLNGYEVCHQLKENKVTSHIPVIFVTAKVAAEDIKMGFQSGGADYISKPAQEDEVLSRINNQLALLDRQKLMHDLLVEAEKMSALGKMVSGITHELASPLGNLTLSLSMLAEAQQQIEKSFSGQYLTSAQLRTFLNKFKEVTQIAQGNLDNTLQILNSFKLITIDQCSDVTKAINLNDYVSSIILSLRPALKKYQHQIVLDIPPEIQLVTKAGAITQILTNLINNSLLHGFEHTNTGQIHISAQVQQQQVILHYADNGTGIPPEFQTRVFDEYFTTKAGQGGSGLGMNIVKQLTETVLHGSIVLHNTPGKGVAFEISFPLQLPSGLPA